MSHVRCSDETQTHTFTLHSLRYRDTNARCPELTAQLARLSKSRMQFQLQEHVSGGGTEVAGSSPNEIGAEGTSPKL